MYLTTDHTSPCRDLHVKHTHSCVTLVIMRKTHVGSCNSYTNLLLHVPTSERRDSDVEMYTLKTLFDKLYAN